MSLNNISESSLFQGLTIKIPKKHQIPRLEQITEQQHKEKFMEDLLHSNVKYFEVFYITSIGEIRGKLEILDDIFLFEPDACNPDNIRIIKQIKKKTANNLQFQIILKHVTGIHQRTLPSYIQNTSKKIIKEHLVEIHLQIKRQKVVLIKLANSDQLPQLMETINSVLISYFPITPGMTIEKTPKKELETILPYYFLNDEMLEANIQSTIKSIIGYLIQAIIASDMFISYIDSNSDIIDQDMLMSLACYFPTIFKSQTWKLLYSSISNGSSIETLMRSALCSEPAILFVKDLDKWIFGAYLSEGIHRSQDQFYGTGESFLFSFKNNNKLKVYNWVNQNRYITLCDNEGLAIGCGDKYGLYIDSEIYHGYSHFCETFNNEVLSCKPNFTIERLEIWGLSQN